MNYHGAWIEQTYTEEPAPVSQIDDRVYIRRNIVQDGDVWKAEEREVSIDTYNSEMFSRRITLDAEAESIVTASEYAAIIMPKQTLMKSAAASASTAENEGDQPLTPSCMEILAQSYAKLIRDGMRTMDDVLPQPSGLKPRVAYLLREPDTEEEEAEE